MQNLSQMSKEELIQELREARKRLVRQDESRTPNACISQKQIDLLPTPIFYKGIDGRYLACNKAFEDFLGLSKQDIVGKTARDLAPESCAKKYEEMDRRLFEEGGMQVYTYRIRGKSDEEHHALFTKVAVHDSTGKATGLVGQLVDVTEQEQTRQALEESERNYRLLALNVQDVIFVFNKEFRLTFTSPSILPLLGYTPEELGRLSLRHILTRSSYPLFSRGRTIRTTELLSGHLEKQPKYWEFECLHKNGSRVWVETITSPMLDDDGRFAGIIGVTRDISKRKQIEQDLKDARQAAEAANQSKSIFLANMSHDLRTPMNGVMGMLQLLSCEHLKADQREYVDMAIRSCRRLNRLLGDILDLSKIEAGKLTVEPVPFSLDEALTGVKDLFALPTEEKGLQLSLRIHPGVPDKLLGDEHRLTQILTNLVGNSLKFTRQGFIEIEVFQSGTSTGSTTLLFRVKDSGVGINPNKLSTLFNPFSQCNGSAYRLGTGLGLAIVRHLSTLMGGGVCVESIPGQGTTFHVHLPFRLQSMDKSVHPHAYPSPTDCTRDSLKVLVVEDDPVSRIVLTSMLEKLGHRVTALDSGSAALDTLRNETFAIVFMDIQLPGLNGVETTRAVRNGATGRQNAELPIVAVTANAMSGDRETYIAAGMTDCINKPVEMTAVQDMIARTFPHTCPEPGGQGCP